MSETTKISRRHFHTFDAFRFLAFFKVFLLHLPVVAFPWFNYLRAGGGIGVQFFFVLSGFLISYIILEEQNNTGRFDLKNFFARRVLRIWPLYYLMVGVAFATSTFIGNPSDSGYQPDWWMSLTFLENYKMMTTGMHPNVSPLGVMWSLCIEEHFYIIWGLLLYFFSKRMPLIITLSIIIGIVSRYIYAANDIDSLDILTNIDLFAYGAIPAYLLVKRGNTFEQSVESIAFYKKMLLAAITIAVVIICSQYTSNDYSFVWMTTLLGVLFSAVLSFTLPVNTRFHISDSNIMSRLGVYTYGLYVYHTLVIILLVKIFAVKHIALTHPLYAIAFILLSLLLTIACSMASYHIFEKFFLRLKKKFR